MAADALDTEAHNSTPEADRQPRVIIPGGKQGLPFERERMPSMARIRRNLGS